MHPFSDAGVSALLFALLFLAVGQEMRSVASLIRELPEGAGPDSPQPHMGRVSFGAAALAALTVLEIAAVDAISHAGQGLIIVIGLVVFAVFLMPLAHVGVAMTGRGYPSTSWLGVALSYVVVGVLVLIAVAAN